MKLNADAKAALRDAGVTQAEWARTHAGFLLPEDKTASTDWGGDACGCPDDRCKDGYHHFPEDECGCLQYLLAEYVAKKQATA